MPHSLKVPGILDDAIVRFAMRTGAMLGRVERDKKLIAVLALDDVCDGHAVRKAGQVTDLGRKTTGSPMKIVVLQLCLVKHQRIW